ncbi:DUF6143 family protein [Brevibacillus borstelensis]|uniref:DUF6143 family protein n=1 Tax=Brevibacillus borstelensis TaxID=45462 RepID=UPI0030BCBC77
MAKHPFSHQPPYFFGMTDMDMYMQMGYYPYPGQTSGEHPDANTAIPLPTAMAMQCKYYLGQTEPFTAGGGNPAWAALVNPLRSEVHLFVNEFVITNRSASHSAEAQLWFGKAASLGDATVSQLVTPGFVQLSPCPQPQGQIAYHSAPLRISGTASATRIISPSSSAAAEKAGHWILGPGTALVFFFSGERAAVDLVVSFGWWEQPIYR